MSGEVNVALHPLPEQEALRYREEAEAIGSALRKAVRRATSPANLITGGKMAGVRSRARPFKMLLILGFIFIAAIPTLAASVYWGLIATPQYATEAKFALRTGEVGGLSVLSSLFGVQASQQAQDTEIVTNYLQSRAVVETLNKDGRLKQIYARPWVDWLSRLAPEARMETIEKYWRKRVTVSIENLSGIVTVNVRAFTAEESLDLAKSMVAFSEQLINELSLRSRREAFEQGRQELQRAQDQLQKANDEMSKARNAQGMLDGTISARVINQVTSALQVELSQTEQALAQNGGLESPVVRVLRVKAANLRAQIAQYEAMIAGVGGGSQNSIATRMTTLAMRQADVDIARQRYAMAAVEFEAARADLDTHATYFAIFMPPSLPQKSTYPKRWIEWLIVVGPSLALFGAFAGMAFLVRDNMAA